MNRDDLLTMPMNKLFLKTALPGMIGMLVIGLYNLVDSIFVGQFIGPEAVTAVTMGYSLVLINQGLLCLFATGAGSLFSRAMGRNDRETMNSLFACVLWPVALLSCLLAVLTFVYAGEILIFLGAEGKTLDLGIEYLHVLAPGFLFAALGPALNFLIRGEGKMKEAMKIMAVGTVLNIILDPLFIKCFGWGMAGAAGATIVGQFSILAGNIWFFLSPHSIVTLGPRSFSLKWGLFPEILKTGFAGMVQSLAIFLQLSILLSLSSSYGNTSGIIMSASFRVMCFFYIPLFGISYGMQPVIGANYGAGRNQRVIDALFYFGRIALCIASILWLFFQVGASFILSWFINDPQIVETGILNFRIFQSSFLLYGVFSVSIMFFTALGKGGESAVLTLGRQVLFFIPLAFIMPRIWGEAGLWLSYPVADLLIVMLSFFLVMKEIRIMKRVSVKN